MGILLIRNYNKLCESFCSWTPSDCQEWLYYGTPGYTPMCDHGQDLWCHWTNGWMESLCLGDGHQRSHTHCDNVHQRSDLGLDTTGWRRMGWTWSCVACWGWSWRWTHAGTDVYQVMGMSRAVPVWMVSELDFIVSHFSFGVLACGLVVEMQISLKHYIVNHLRGEITCRSWNHWEYLPVNTCFMRKRNNVDSASLNGPSEAIMVDLFVKLVELVCSQGNERCVECQCTCERDFLCLHTGDKVISISKAKGWRGQRYTLVGVIKVKGGGYKLVAVQKLKGYKLVGVPKAEGGGGGSGGTRFSHSKSWRGLGASSVQYGWSKSLEGHVLQWDRL